MSYTCSDLLRRRGFATSYMTHGIAFLRRFADAAFSTNFTENGGIIKNILCFEQTENKQALLKPSGENAPFLPFKNAIEQRANNGKTSLYFTALKAATKPRESHVIAR